MKAELKNIIDDLVQRIQVVARIIANPAKKAEIEELEKQSSDPDLWQDRNKAQKLLMRLTELKGQAEEVSQLEDKLSSAGSLLDSTGEESGDDLEVIQSELKDVTKKLELLEMKTYLSGPYDISNAIVTIHAGQGGTEACDWAQMLERMYIRYGERKGWKAQVVEERSGEEAGIKKATIFIQGRLAYGFLKREKGAHRLVRLSPFNANSLRQTSFALVEVMPMFEDDVEEIKVNPNDLEIDFTHSSGHGGQNVNKVSTAVRIKHIPTGIVVECQTQRYQDQNRKIAMQILKGKLWQLEEEEKEAKIQAVKGKHKIAGWGNQIRSYVLHPYKMVKDLRTGWEEHDPTAVLDGELDGFIKAELSLPLEV